MSKKMTRFLQNGSIKNDMPITLSLDPLEFLCSPNQLNKNLEMNVKYCSTC